MKEINVAIRVPEVVDAILLHTGIASYLSGVGDKAEPRPVFSHALDRMLAGVAWEAIGTLSACLAGKVKKVDRQGEPMLEGQAVLTIEASDSVDADEVEVVARAVVIDCAMESVLMSVWPDIAAKYKAKGASLTSTLRGMLLPDMSTLRLTGYY